MGPKPSKAEPTMDQNHQRASQSPVVFSRVAGLRNSPRLPFPRPLSRLSLITPDPIRLGPSLSPVDPFSTRYEGASSFPIPLRRSSHTPKLPPPDHAIIPYGSSSVSSWRVGQPKRSYNADADARNTNTAPGASALASATTPEAAQDESTSSSTFWGLTLDFPQLREKDSALLRPKPSSDLGLGTTAELPLTFEPAVHQLFARLHQLLGGSAQRLKRSERVVILLCPGA
ncbi:hypothetical protein BDP55DRAFT_736277 [Colletotrichum godetiae]|uniref:Uncharacterized protein n=1 Tax=Colletotrichum godetiae TaxID=1209918 RepID=A0AAJ0B2F2_9PEZI|nr:uncharacterized protein BDP55DRAFT_736277 [Colletotrichum godetiae]KAK1701215.1 hypothetical protein BDP55DRAFT_736277 [Colletotrichum godetiae]